MLKGNTRSSGTGFGLLVFGVLGSGLLSMTGCGGGEAGSEAEGGAPAAAQPMSAQVQGLVDQGNTAQRAGDYPAALAHYRAAMEHAPAHPVPQFGALMAATALGEEALVDSLTALLAESSPDLLAMLNPDGSMGGGMPANPHAGGMPGGMPGMTPPPGTEGQVEGLPPGHPTLFEVTPDSTTRPDTTGGH